MHLFMRIMVFVFLKMFAICGENNKLSKKPLPFFRRQVEELIEDPTIDTKNDDSQSKLVSFLVQNVKEIFNDISDGQTNKNWFGESHKSTILFTPNRTTTKSTLDLLPKSYTYTDDIMLYENLSVTTKPFFIQTKGDKFRVENIDELNEKRELMQLSNGLLLLGKTEFTNPGEVQFFDNNSTGNATDNVDIRRSCIFCNNLDVSHCSYPKNKLIPSIVCKNEDDVCYTQHTPFGIVDRGCFNVNNNKTIYVCNCNLCNYFSISELPYLYTKKKEWIDDIIELSRTKGLRTSIFKEMSCLRCEVSMKITRKGDIHDDTSCLQGNIGHVAVQECEEDQICGIIAIRSTGYLWRGCVKTPLYNNWLTLCDYDLCNYDDIASIYDRE